MSAGRKDLAGAASASRAGVRSAGVLGALPEYRAGRGPGWADPRAGHAFVPRDHSLPEQGSRDRRGGSSALTEA
jgi:hypothetical protein